MKSSFRRIAAVMGAVALIMPAAVMADPNDPPPPGGIFYFNDGNGTCGYAQQTPWGVQVSIPSPARARSMAADRGQKWAEERRGPPLSFASGR